MAGGFRRRPIGTSCGVDVASMWWAYGAPTAAVRLSSRRPKPAPSALVDAVPVCGARNDPTGRHGASRSAALRECRFRRHRRRR